MRIGLGLGLSNNSSGVASAFSVNFTGLSSDSLGSYARIGNEAGISYSITPDNGTDTVAWDDNSPNAGSDYGTGANPTSLAALSGSTLYCHVTDGGDTVTKAVGVRYAPGSAAGALPDQNGWVENTAITTVDPTGDFTLTDLTGAWSASGLPSGVSINSGTGAITGTPDTPGSGSAVVTFTDQYGRTVSSGFSYTVAAVNVPDAFVDANWSVATGSGANELDIAIASLPADNNDPITNVQYDIDGSGTWINLPAYAGTGTYTVTMAAASTSYGIRLRAVNSAGNGAAGNTESATSGGGAATVPSAFVDADWSVAAGSDHKDLDITIATLPNNGGAAITDIEYDVDASGSWVSLGTAVTGTTTVTMAAGNTSYAIRLRAVNSVGNATAGNSESATSKALTITGYSFNGTDTISFSLNGTGTLYTSTTASTETDAADIENGVGAIDTDTDVLSSGTNNITVSYPNTFDDNWLNLVAKSGSEYSNVISNQYTFGDIVPRAFVDANWSVATGSGANELDVTIASLPSSGGATITDVEYDVDGGDTWTSLGATTGTITITMAAASTSYGIRLRGVNSVGNGLAGNTESATSGSAGDVTAPTLSSPTDAANGQNASTGSVSTNEGNGTLYWVVTTSATAPSAAQVKAGQDNTSTAATASGSQSVSGTGVQTLSPAPSGLTASTAYTTHFMHEDAATNQSTVSSASGFTTAAVWHPSSLFGSGESGLIFDASDISTLWTDAGVTQVSAADDPVGQFDSLVNSHVADQTVASSKPLYKLDGSSNPYVDFDGTDDWLDLPNSLGFSGSQNRSVFMAGSSPSFLLGSGAGIAKRWNFRRESGGTALRIELQGSGYSSAFDSSGLDVYGCVLSGTQLQDHVLHKGLSTEAATGTTTVNTTDSSNDLGASGNNNEYEQMTLYALVAIDRALTTQEISDLKTWLASKPGITLS